MININNLTDTELEESKELDLLADSEHYLQELSEQEEINIIGGGPRLSFTVLIE